MGVRAPGPDTQPVIRPTRGLFVEAYIVIFLLFFAVLAFAWFYLQRAKARDAAAASDAVAPAVASPPAEAPAEPVEPEVVHNDQPAS